MKCFRILPEICARTMCPFSNSTRNMALGNGSTTVPVTSMASGLAVRGSSSVTAFRFPCTGRAGTAPHPF